jgi:23S rRNA pseudouridine2605 synthase
MSEPTNHDRRDRRKPRPPSGGKAAPKRAFIPKGEGPDKAVAPPVAVAFGKQRIAKVIARAGLCSRRDAEVWIGQGRVSVNGITLTSPALNVDETDQILVDGVALEAREPTRLFLFHKPRGYVTTAKDPQNRPTVFDLLPKDLPRLVSIGRLDINTQGLLLLTNDGGLARVLELPRTGWLRRYRVRANGKTDQTVLDQLVPGITVDGMNYGPIEAHLDRFQGANVWLTIGLREGKNREVKRVLDSLGLIVNRLIRVSFGPFQLLDLEEGAVAEVSARVLKDQLGEAITLAAKADFESAKARPKERAQGAGAAPKGSVEAQIEAKAPRRERPEKGKRKHISVLRAERRAAALLPAKVARGSTADRHGREIAVERMSSRAPKWRAAKSGLPLERPLKRPGRNATIDRIRGDRVPRPERDERPQGGPAIPPKWDQKQRLKSRWTAPLGGQQSGRIRDKVLELEPPGGPRDERRASDRGDAARHSPKGRPPRAGKQDAQPTRPADTQRVQKSRSDIDQSGRPRRRRPPPKKRDRPPR